MGDDAKKGSLRTSRGADDRDTESLRRERGADHKADDPRERMADVPIAPHSAGVLGAGVAGAEGDAEASAGAEADRKAAERRESR